MENFGAGHRFVNILTEARFSPKYRAGLAAILHL